MSETTQRVLRLLDLLQSRSVWTGPELAERLGVTTRSIRRDVERLRELGYPVNATQGAGGGYRLGAGRALPPLLLTDDEAVAVAIGLRAAATQGLADGSQTTLTALAKLEQVLPPHLRRRVHALGSATTGAAPGGPTVDAQDLTTIAAACRDFECVRFAYTSRDGAATRREVEPHSLVNLGRRWYLVGWDRRREDWRTFRVDRIARPAATGARFTARTLPASDAAEYVRERITAGNRFEAHVVVHAPADELALRHPYIAGALEPIDEHRCEYRTSDDDLEWLALRIAMLGVDVQVHEPPELVAQLDALAGRLRRATAPARARRT